MDGGGIMAEIVIKTKEEVDEERFLESLIPTNEEVEQARLEMAVLMIMMEVM